MEDSQLPTEGPAKLEFFDRAIARVSKVPVARAFLSRALQTAAKIPYFANRMGSWGWYSRFAGGLPQMDRTYSQWMAALGDIRVSSIFQAGRRWASINLGSARLQLLKLDTENQQTEITQHPCLDLLARPNPYCTWTQFIATFAFNWIAKGTVYVRKQRDESQPGKPVVALWPEPYWKVKPIVEQTPDGNYSEFISGYKVERNGVWYPVSPMDMIVFRDGWDPETREGENWMQAIVPELFTDKQVGNHIARMVSNGLLPPMVLGVGDKKNAPSPEVLKKLQTLMDAKLGDGKSNVLLMSGNISSAKLQLDYGAEALIKLRQTPEQRFASGMGVSVIGLLFGAGVEVSTYSNVEQYMRRDYRNWIVPVHTTIAEVLTQELLIEFGPIRLQNGKRFVLGFDYSQVPEMQRDKKTDADWVCKLWDDDLLTQAEAREQMGYPGGEPKYKTELFGNKATDPAQLGSPGVPVPTTGDPVPVN